MRRVFTSIIAAALVCALGAPIVAARAVATPGALPHLLIVELQTSSSAKGASEKFIKVYNPGESSVDVTGWHIQYRPAKSTDDAAWKVKATVACVGSTAPDCKVIIAPHDWLLFSSYHDTAQKLIISSALATSGGQVRLMKPSDTTPQDMLAYGDAAVINGNTPAQAPKKGQSLRRKVGNDQKYVNTKINADDFAIGCDAPTPSENPSTLTPTTPCPTPPPSQDDTPEDSTDEPQPDTDSPDLTNSGTYLPLTITELFPDPTTPQQDSTDEFIELFNPNNQTVNLDGYELQSGSNFRYKYVLSDQTIAPGQYIAVFSAESRLSLTNTGTGVRLLDPNGEVVDEVANYGAAKSGQSWMALTAGTWQWSLTPTPGAPNSLTQPAAKVLTASTKKSSTKTASTSKASTTKAAPKSPVSDAASITGQPQSSDTPNYWLLAAFGILIVGYGLYEYRKEISAGFSKLRAALPGKK